MCSMKKEKITQNPQLHNVSLSFALPMKNTWIQTDAVSMPPIPPRTPRAKSLLQGANPPPPAPHLLRVSAVVGCARHFGREDTLTAFPHQALGLRLKRKERCWDKSNTWLISFFFPSTTSQKERVLRFSCPDMKLWTPL